MRKPINYFIASMALSDLLYSIFLLPQRLTELYVDAWPIGGSHGQVLCTMFPFIIDVSTVVSIPSLVLIAVERFGAVVFPLGSLLISSKRCPFFILTTWIVAVAISSPYLVAFKLVEYPENWCERRWSEAFGESSSVANFPLAVIVVFFHMPIFLVTVLYSIILVKLKAQIFLGKQSVNAELQRAKTNRKVLKMAIAIVLGFVLCWVPFSIIVLVVSFSWVACVVEHLLLIPSFMAYSNCIVNPCIYFIFLSVLSSWSEETRQVLRPTACKKNVTSCKCLETLNTFAR